MRFDSRPGLDTSVNGCCGRRRSGGAPPARARCRASSSAGRAGAWVASQCSRRARAVIERSVASRGYANQQVPDVDDIFPDVAKRHQPPMLMAAQARADEALALAIVVQQMPFDFAQHSVNRPGGCLGVIRSLRRQGQQARPELSVQATWRS
jgi:hypothetical protein